MWRRGSPSSTAEQSFPRDAKPPGRWAKRHSGALDSHCLGTLPSPCATASTGQECWQPRRAFVEPPLSERANLTLSWACCRLSFIDIQWHTVGCAKGRLAPRALQSLAEVTTTRGLGGVTIQSQPASHNAAHPATFADLRRLLSARPGSRPGRSEGAPPPAPAPLAVGGCLTHGADEPPPLDGAGACAETGPLGCASPPPPLPPPPPDVVGPALGPLWIEMTKGCTAISLKSWSGTSGMISKASGRSSSASSGGSLPGWRWLMGLASSRSTSRIEITYASPSQVSAIVLWYRGGADEGD
jgi:hypothetical protein